MQRLITLLDFLFCALILFSQEAELLFMLVFGFLEDFSPLSLLYLGHLVILILVRCLPPANVSGR